MAEREPVKLVANNKKAYHDYFILEKHECGMALLGTEMKSIRQGKCSIKEALITIDRRGEAWVEGMNVSPYDHGNIMNKDSLRKRKLLLHKKEIRKLAEQAAEQGMTIVPLQVYLKDGRAKLEIGLAKGKKLYDKREDTKKRELRREVQRDFRMSLK
ncbi:SsrA-binding protein SmpB [Lachnoclostridium sp. Marseille-P6806]|uniref:SsrA-binding protein SmpB n=1 Tax=Lachnoclostridium sp. Marseille-P6806 TaxID=2364793 RepID=UPI00102FB34E|nr:SsrA-binding protein SmpB [Lachnoclostridium sp. Marseille-P6806]